jgi:hypothetical protein
MKKAILVILGLLVLGACARTPKHIPPYALLIEPAIQIYKDPILGVSNPYKTFSVFSKSILTDRTQMGGGILEKQMLFALRNRFEQLGYKFVNLDQFPDFLATVDGSAEFKEVHVPPQNSDGTKLDAWTDNNLVYFVWLGNIWNFNDNYAYSRIYDMATLYKARVYNWSLLAFHYSDYI